MAANELGVSHTSSINEVDIGKKPVSLDFYNNILSVVS